MFSPPFLFNHFLKLQWNAEKSDLTDKCGSSYATVQDPIFPAFSDLIRVLLLLF